MTLNELHDRDFFAWTRAAAAAMRAGQLDPADTAAVADEIEDMGNSERRELRHRLEVILVHLLKWQHQPERRSKSWQATIALQRVKLEDLLDDNPSLRPRVYIELARAYRTARLQAAVETGLAAEVFPAVVPWDANQVITAGEPSP